ncbi:hypothetical protein CHGG_01960 [Chaetomium globosum CBS 148.51]|uniref:MICOS complex subunit MIC60 n=1 Tax=Chaetomium globosum (strain ATCC 6205 / CBS 148.51 / DSM 1962 / NBRC 6347 / NRRL 1970) TaxID=306901 RepID=Q2HCU4_CHAGB|nr:uncharacterized protein CHGG_01960 [Chaetomium globosum CBS 148.51]EAQ93725.1 hypothetical protein CHGG_01960 [Chaetomium globosum CBS 148.51]
MLRTSLQSVRALGSRPVAAAAGRQWQVSAARRAVVSGQRFYASNKTRPDEAKIPASETLTAPSTPPPPPPSLETAASTTIPADNVPLTPPAPDSVAAEPANSAPPPPLPTPRKKKGFFRRLRNFFLTLTLLSALGFGGGVWYSRINDNFHDFFTEYIPYGEQAVLYLEEMDFKKRSLTWLAGWETAGRQSSAVQKVAAAKEPSKKAEPVVVAPPKEEAPKVPAPEVKAEEPKKPAPAPAAEKKRPSKKVTEKKAVENKPVEKQPEPETSLVPATTALTPAQKAFKAPEVDEPSRWPPASPIDPLAVPNAADPVVQDLVRMLNDIITVINHDGANDRYGATIGKAKNEISKVGQKILDIKTAVEKDAAQQVRQRVDGFDQAANDLVARLEAAMTVQEQQFRREFEAEMERLRKSYDNKVHLIQERERQLAEEKLNNQLLEQAVQLQRAFTQDIKKHVEQERDGRLGKLNELKAAVEGLEKLTAGWNEVIDANLRTQQLHVAVEAVRASLEDAHHPRPFIKELVALKEIAAQDPVVDAAIASVHPSAYQRGISTPAELIDRFRRVAAEVRKASLLPDDAGVASHASSYVLSKVMFKKQGLAAGDDVESILTRTQTFLEEGDLDNAAREMNGLTGWSKTLSRDWLGEVRKVLEVRQALEVIQTEARLQSLKVE